MPAEAVSEVASRMAAFSRRSTATPSASKLAPATTPRRAASPPTATGRPRSDASSRCSTEVKNASLSTWTIRRREGTAGFRTLRRNLGVAFGLLEDERLQVEDRADPPSELLGVEGGGLPA